MKQLTGRGDQAATAGRSTAAASLVAAFIATCCWVDTSVASELRLDLTAKRPGVVTGMNLDIRYARPNDPGGKPPAIRRLIIDAPAGTSFDRSATPICEASDSEAMLQGPSACPPQSRLAEGEVTVITGFGPPFDPLVSPTPVFNDGRGWLEISQEPSSQATIAVTRLEVSGNRIQGDIAAAPGGPPDGESAVSSAVLRFPAATGYVTTPPACPPSGKWVAVGRFTFSDGSGEVVRSEDECLPSRAAGKACARSLAGTRRADRIAGSPGGERIRGFGGADSIRGAGGRDCIHGAGGADGLRGGRGADRIAGGPGTDFISSGPGSDQILSRDGVVERVRCGAGRDRVHADLGDLLTNCENGPSRRGAATPTAQGP